MKQWYLSTNPQGVIYHNSANLIIQPIYLTSVVNIAQCREIDNTAYLSNICCNITILCRYTYCETRLWWPRLIPFKAAQLIPVVNLWKPLNIMKIKICTVTFAGVQLRV